MSALVPEQRQDKNGHLVTRHVKADQGSGVSAGSIPPPSLSIVADSRPSFEEVGHSGFVESVGSRFDELGVKPPEILTQLLWQLKYNSSLCGDADKKLYDMLPDLDAKALGSLTGGMHGMRIESGMNSFATKNAQIFGIAIHAYEFSRVIDDAKLPVPYTRNTDYSILRTGLELFAKDTKVKFTPGTISDLEGQYFLEALDMSINSFSSAGEYYRSLGILKEQQEEIKPYLPVLIAMNTAFADGKGWYFNDEYYLWENIEMAKRFPVDRIEAIAIESIRRGKFDEEFAEEVANSNSDTLNAGLL